MALVDPTGKVSGLTLAESHSDIRWPRMLKGTAVGFLSNGKPNVASLFQRLSEALQAEGAVTIPPIIKPGPTVPAGKERVAELVEATDIVITGVCDGGTATSWGVVDTIELVNRGMPVVLLCTEAFVDLAESTCPGHSDGFRIAAIPHPLSSLTEEEVDRLAKNSSPRLLTMMLQGGSGTEHQRDQDSKSAWSEPLKEGWEASNALFERGWTDGLPVFLPTEDSVGKFLKDAGCDHLFSSELLVPPRNGIATAETVAANAILAGMPPKLLPYLAATLEAVCQAEFNLFGIQTTTNPATPAIIVGGPRRRAHGFNHGLGALGPGNMANATLGRALRLCMQNLGGGSAQKRTDPATLGQPGKYIFCFADNEEENPWKPLRMQVGGGQIKQQDDALTVIAATGTTNLIIKCRDGEEFLDMLAGSIKNISSNDYMFGGHPLLVLCPEHAAVLARDGWSLEAIQERVFMTTKIRFGDFILKNREMTIAPRRHEFLTLDDETLIPIVERPSDFLICVAGGPSMHSTYVPSFGGSTPTVAKVRPTK
jgi:hypothetical protein